MKSSILAFAAVSAANCTFAAGQAQPPGGAIRIIVAFPAGSPPDFIMRLISESMQQAAGQTLIIADFPMTVTGKVQKFALRERMIAALALEEKVAA